MEKLNIFQKINAVMKEVDTVFKNVKVTGYGNGYNAVSHDDVTALLHKPLANVGIVALPNMDDHILSEGVTSKGSRQYISSVWVSLELINADNPEEKVKTRSFAMGFDSQEKGPGKAYSMAVKYCYLKLFMLESQDNEEERIDSPVQYNVQQSNRASSNQIGKIKYEMNNRNIPLTQEIEKKLNTLDSRKASMVIESLMKTGTLPARF